MKVGTPPPVILFHQKYLKCEECNEKDCLCLLNSSTLILDTPVCRDGSVMDRARYTAPWPLFVTKSKIQIGKAGVFTRAELPTHLVFGPCEGVYKQGERRFSELLHTEYTDIVQLLNDFIDSSDTSFSNWLSFVATTSLKHLANCSPILYKGSIFYKTIKTIPRETELLLWTGIERASKLNSSNDRDIHRDAGPVMMDTPLECSWCRLRFSDVVYLRDHQARCSLSKSKPAKPAEPSRSQGGEVECTLRRSKRAAVKSVRSYSLLSPPLSPEQRDDGDKLSAISGRSRSPRSLKKGNTSTSGFGVILSCSNCGLECKDQKSLDQHIRQQHRSKVVYYPADLSQLHSSPEQSKRHPTSPILVEKDYNYHLGNETCVFDLPWVRTLLKMNREIRQNNSSSLRCSSCHMQFYNHFGAAIHEHSCMDGRRPYKCGHCGKRFQLYFSVVKHMKRHEEAEKKILATLVYNCEVGKSYYSTENPNISMVESSGVISSTSLNPTAFSKSRDVELREGCAQNITERTLHDEDSSWSLLMDGDAVFRSDVLMKEERLLSPFVDNVDKENWPPIPSLADNELKSATNFEGKSSKTIASLDAAKFMTKIDVSDSIYGGRRRRHECCICGQRFYRRKHIKKHMELHENETTKVYKCFYCNLWFGCLDIVKYHEQSSHDGETKQVISNCLTGEQSFLRKLLTVLAKEGTKGKYSEYFNAKGTIKDKKFECEICSKKFTSFYRVRKHKIVSHSELMDLLEAANDLAVVPKEQLKESNILAILSSIKEESVRERIQDACGESGAVQSQSCHVPQIQLTLLGDSTNNNHTVMNGSDAIGENFNVKLVETSQGSETPSQPLLNKKLKIFVARNVLDDQPTSGKLILPKGVEFEQVCSNVPTKEVADDSHGEAKQGVKYTFTQTKSSALSRFLNETDIRAQRKIDLKQVIKQTFANVSLNNVVVPKRKVYSEKVMKQCKVCGKKLSPKTNMKGHLRSHTGERHYECQYCHKRYSLLSTLKRHIRIHTGYRPFKCNLCDRTYTQSSNLKRHYRQHTGERPFRCTFCPRRYAEKFSLNRHLKKHKEAKAHTCHVCKKGFSEECLLARHIQVAHDCS